MLALCDCFYSCTRWLLPACTVSLGPQHSQSCWSLRVGAGNNLDLFLGGRMCLQSCPHYSVWRLAARRSELITVCRIHDTNNLSRKQQFRGIETCAGQSLASDLGMNKSWGQGWFFTCQHKAVFNCRDMYRDTQRFGMTACRCENSPTQPLSPEAFPGPLQSSSSGSIVGNQDRGGTQITQIRNEDRYTTGFTEILRI